MLDDKAWHSSGSAVAVALLNKGGRPCSPVGPGARGIMSHIGSGRRLRHIGTVTGQGFFCGPGHVEEPSCRWRYKSVRLYPRHPAGRGEEKKGGERHGKAACASVQPVPVRALRPPLL